MIISLIRTDHWSTGASDCVSPLTRDHSPRSSFTPRWALRWDWSSWSSSRGSLRARAEQPEMLQRRRRTCLPCHGPSSRFHRWSRRRCRVRRARRQGRWSTLCVQTVDPHSKLSCSEDTWPRRCWGCWRGRCRGSGRTSHGTFLVRCLVLVGAWRGWAPGWWSACSSALGKLFSVNCSCRWEDSCRDSARIFGRGARCGSA